MKHWIAVLDGEVWAPINQLDLIEVTEEEAEALEHGVLRPRDLMPEPRRVAFVEPLYGKLSLQISDRVGSDD